MDLIRNFPAITILMCLFSGIISSGLKQKAARTLNTLLLVTVIGVSLVTFVYTAYTGQAFVYVMGRFPAPWGNELRAGCLEGLMALFFSIIMLLSIVGGIRGQNDDIAIDKMNLYFIMINLIGRIESLRTSWHGQVLLPVQQRKAGEALSRSVFLLPEGHDESNQGFFREDASLFDKPVQL